jgi:hypothetical protein
VAGIPRHTLLRNVADFAQEKGLMEDLTLLQKGALVAQDPTNYEDIQGEYALDDTEVEVLRNEVIHKWRHPKSLYFTIILCSIGAAVQGCKYSLILDSFLFLDVLRVQTAEIR